MALGKLSQPRGLLPTAPAQLAAETTERRPRSFYLRKNQHTARTEPVVVIEITSDPAIILTHSQTDKLQPRDVIAALEYSN
jgi:hypothetical protein